MTEARISFTGERWQAQLGLRLLAYNLDAWRLHEAAADEEDCHEIGWPVGELRDLPEGTVLQARRALMREQLPAFE